VLLRVALPQRGVPDLTGCRPRRPARRRSRSGPTAIALAAGLLSALSGACRRPDTSDVDVRWTLQPERPAVGPATLTVTLGEAHAAASGTEVRVVGHMTHPGMPPVVATTTRRGPGIYEANMTLTMAGDWVLLVTVQLADGRRVERRVDVPGVVAGER
jgi:hypothetical protein